MSSASRFACGACAARSPTARSARASGTVGPEKSQSTVTHSENALHEASVQENPGVDRLGADFGMGARLSLAADSRRGAVLSRRFLRRTDARDRAGDVEAARPADGGREQARAGGDAWQRRGGEGAARRLHAAPRLQSERDQRFAVLQADARPGRGFRAYLAPRERAGGAARESVDSREEPAGVHRLREAASGKAILLLLRQRQRPASLHGDVPLDDRTADE